MTVPDYQSPLAIGKEGQNARLAARLTGWRIDIRSDGVTTAPPAGATSGSRGPARGGASDDASYTPPRAKGLQAPGGERTPRAKGLQAPSGVRDNTARRRTGKQGRLGWQ